MEKADLHFVTARKRERELLKPTEGLSHGKAQSWMGGSRDRREAIISEAVGSEPNTPLPNPNPVPPLAVVQVLVVHGIVKCLSRRDTAQEHVKVPAETSRTEPFQNLKAEGPTRRVAAKNVRKKAALANLLTTFPVAQHACAGCVLNRSEDEEEFWISCLI